MYSDIIVRYRVSDILKYSENNIDNFLLENLIPLNNVFIIGKENFNENISSINSNET